MWRVRLAILFAAQVSLAQTGPGRANSQSQPPPALNPDSSTIIIPAGTRVELSLTAPVWAKTAKAGDNIYGQVSFPVVVGSQMAIPPGTYVEGRIDSLTRPGTFSPHARLQIDFTKIIFSNGYVVVLPNAPLEAAIADDVIAAVATPYVQVSRASDLLLDNSSQIEIILQVPLALDASRVAAAVRQVRPTQLAKLKSANVCRPIPGTPGTSDTVIPGAPGTSGTPDVVIPGAPGMPDTVIPGTPPTPPSPPTVIPGSPGTPEISCPALPVVVPNTKPQEYKGAFVLDATAWVAGKQLAAGPYEVTWKGPGPGPGGKAEIIENGSPIVSAQARVVLLNMESSADIPKTRTNSDGSVSLDSLRFAGQRFALYFD